MDAFRKNRPTMSRKRPPVKEIVNKLREADVLLGRGQTVVHVTFPTLRIGLP